MITTDEALEITPTCAPPGARPRYLFVINELGFIYSHFWALAVAIQDAGWEVFIASAAVADPSRAIQAGFTFVRIHPTFGIGSPLHELRSFLELRRAVRSVRPAIVHTVSLKNVLLGGMLARIEGVPALLSAVTGLGTMFVEDRMVYRIAKPILLAGMRWVHGRKRTVMALENSDDRQYFLDHSVVRHDYTFLIPGAGLEPAGKQPHSVQDGVPVILCVSRMIRNKGILELIEAAQILRREGLAFELTLVGDIDPRNPTSLSSDELHRLHDTGVANWLGPRSDVPALLATASIFCLPTYYREGMPRSLIESAAAGLPIVTTDVPGCRDVVEHGVTGLLVAPQSAASLAGALSLLLRSGGLREKMGNAGRCRFEEKFTTRHVFDAFNRCYAALDIPLVLKTDSSR